MGLDLYGPHFVTGDSAVAALARTLNQLVENILAGATPATGSVTDAKVAADAAIAQSKIAGLVADLATKLNAAGIVAKAAATTNQDRNGLDVIDGYQTVAGDQVLLTAQTTPSENGPWIVAAGAWTRPADFATGSVHLGRAIVVSGGTLAGSVWTLNTTAPVTVGTTAQTWVNAPVRSGTFVQVHEGPLSLLDARVEADNTGAVAVGPALSAAFALLPGGVGEVYAPPGLYLMEAGVVLPERSTFGGAGYTDTAFTPPETLPRGTTCFLKRGNFDAFIVADGATLKNLDIEGDAGNGGDGVYVMGGRSFVEKVSSRNHGGDGFRFGAKVDGVNSNLWHGYDLIARGNGGRGVYVHDASTPVGPPGVDANKGTLHAVDLRANGSHGLQIENAIDVDVFSLHTAGNTGTGWRLSNGCRGAWLYSPYSENNGNGEGVLDVGADDNVVLGVRSYVAQDGYVDNGARNLILGRDSNTARFTYQSRVDFRSVVVTDKAISGGWQFRQNATTRALEVALIDTTAPLVEVHWVPATGGLITQRFGIITAGRDLITKSASFTLALTDYGKVIEANSASAIVATIPPDASVALPIGTSIEIVRAGAGTVNVAPDTGVTLRSKASNRQINGQWASATLRKRAANDWALIGDLIA